VEGGGVWGGGGAAVSKHILYKILDGKKGNKTARMQTKRARLKHGPQQRRTIALEKKEKKRPSRIYTQEQIFYFFYNYYVTCNIQCLACVCVCI
jgi:hypothetical protein